MSDLKIVRVEKVTWSCRPVSETEWVLLIRVRARTSERSGNLLLKIVIKDNIRRYRIEDDPADPLYADDGPPFQYRVDRRDHRKRVLAAVTKSHVGFEFKDVTTVSVQLFLLRGVYVTAAKIAHDFDRVGSDLEAFFSTFVEEVGDWLGLTSEAERNSDDFKPLKQDLGQLTLDARINTLQDRSQMPEPGEPIESGQLFPSFDVETESDRAKPLIKALHRFSVRYIPNGVRITWMATSQVLELSLPDPKAPNSGFSFSFKDNPDLSRKDVLGFIFYDDLLHIRYSGTVKVSLSSVQNPSYQRKPDPVGHALYYKKNFVDPVAWAEQGYPRKFTKKVFKELKFSPNHKVHRPLKGALFFRLEKIGSVQDLPAPHEDFTVKRSDDEAQKNYESYYSAPKVPVVLKLVLDTGIGFIPFIGDFVDFVEFNHMLATGKNRWDEDVDDTDILLAGLACIPILGIAAGAVKLVK